MQKYKEINGNDYVKNSRTTINETMQSIQSMNSGTAFPTNNLFEGMKCYRTDLKKTYTLTDVENNTWVEDAHATLADTATKLQTPRTLSLTGKAAGSATFDGSANASINVTSVNADTASKLSTARKINITGNATGSTSFDGSGDVNISTTVNESKHATTANTATKLATARTISLTGDTAGSASFDGSGDISISTTVNESKHAAAADSATTATKVNATAPNGGATDLVFGIMANDDSARISIGGSINAGWLEIATSDDGNEPIYARQYSGSFLQDGAKSVTNEAVLLDGSGNTKFPHNVTAANFVGHLTGNADSADVAKTLQLVEGDGSKKPTTFNWVDKDGQPQWLWGNNDDANTYVYNPSNFHVAAADVATHANDVNDATVNATASAVVNSCTAPASGVIDILSAVTGSSDLTSTNKLRSYIGSINNGGWYNVISVRHRNGAQDGANYGMLIYSGLTDASSIRYRKQCTKQWTEERTLLDSENYNSFAPTKTGGGASGTWGINISGNAASATNADKVDGYHASDIINRISASNNGIVAASLKENGYAKFANGLILQWGNASGEGDEDVDNSTTFPIAFPSTCFTVLLTSKRYLTGTLLVSQSKTSFTWEARGGLISWIALGM